MPPQTRRWVATINNPIETDDPKTWDVAFVTGQKEKGAQGTEHYQLYVELSKKQRLSYMKKINSKAHWEIARGTQKQCIDYVTKEETRIEEPFECGTKMRTNADGSTKRARSDLQCTQNRTKPEPKQHLSEMTPIIRYDIPHH